LGALMYKLDWRFDEQGLPADLVKRFDTIWVPAQLA
jgi:hypothetical protein